MNQKKAPNTSRLEGPRRESHGPMLREEHIGILPGAAWPL